MLDPIETALDALREAAQRFNEWGEYASYYYREKHDLAGTIKRTHAAIAALTAAPQAPIDVILHCPACGMQHVDKPSDEMAKIEASERGFDWGSRDWEQFVEVNEWTNPPHRSHLCHGCGHIWRPADVPTNGVEAIKTRGKNDSPAVQPPAARLTDTEDLYERLHSLSKSLEYSGRLDEQENPGTYATVLDAMNFVRSKTA